MISVEIRNKDGWKASAKTPLTIRAVTKVIKLHPDGCLRAYPSMTVHKYPDEAMLEINKISGCEEKFTGYVDWIDGDSEEVGYNILLCVVGTCCVVVRYNVDIVVRNDKGEHCPFKEEKKHTSRIANHWEWEFAECENNVWKVS